MTTADPQYFLALLEDDPEKLYDRAPCGYLTTTGDGTIRKVNQTFLTMTGYTADELVGIRTFSEILTVGGRIYHETHYAPLLHMGGTAREIAFEIVRRDGGTVPVLVNAVTEQAEDGAVHAIRVAVFDATQRRRYEAELLAARKRAETSEAHARALARTLQQALIPAEPPPIAQIEVATRFRPAGDGTQVGGDFYDVFQLPDGDWVVVVGDVCGKGAAAAVVTALVRYSLRAAVMDHERLADALAHLNTVMLHSGTDRFCTVLIVRFRRTDEAWELRVSSAGHPLPLLRGVDGAVRTVGEPGTVAGVIPDPRFVEVTQRLHPGEILLLHTDGLPDARRNGDTFGDQRIHDIVAGAGDTAGALADALLGEVLRFQDEVARDDIAIVVLRAE
jgi:sigma-B regulation protein RsbU (phosphoserine phosphatase)